MDFLLYLSLIPALGCTAQWLAWRTGMPGILLLLLFGVILGRFIEPDTYLANLTDGSTSAGAELLFPLVSLAVAVIMLEGGLSLKFSELAEAGAPAARLCTIGAAVTFLGVAAAAHFTLSYAWPLCFLLGAILVVTGPTVIGPLLRQVRPSRRVATTLKWEGIVIDPIGAVLAVLVFEQMIKHAEQSTFGTATLMLLKTAGVGVGLGALGGWLMSQALRRFWVPDNLHGVASLAVALLLFACSNLLAHESGLITVTVLGVWLVNQHDFDIDHVIEFHENLRTFLIGCLFIVLGSRIDLNDVLEIGLPGVGFVVLLIVLIRPLAVFVSCIGCRLELREQAFIAALAPRGIVAAAISSVFALELSRQGAVQIDGVDQFATVTFMAIVGTVAVYGLAAAPAARLLGLADEKSNGVLIVGADAWVRDLAKEFSTAGLPVLLIDTNYNKVSKANQNGLRAMCVNILNEHARDELPMAGIGHMMAMTNNDEVNSFAVKECRSLLNRSSLFQLTFKLNGLKGRRGMTRNLLGRELFGPGMTFTKMRDQYDAGSKYKTTLLSSEFTYADFTTRYRDGLLLLATIDEDKRLRLNTVDKPLEPEPGQKIVCMVSSIVIPEDHNALREGQSA